MIIRTEAGLVSRFLSSVMVFLFFKACRQSLGPTEPRIQWVEGTVSRG